MGFAMAWDMVASGASRVSMDTLAIAGTGTMAWTLYDLIHMILHQDVYVGMLLQQGVHHVMLVGVCLANATYDTRFSYVLPVMSMAELSTVFLNIRQVSKLQSSTHARTRARAHTHTHTHTHIDTHTTHTHTHTPHTHTH
jgi:hypothetical protein